MQADGRSPAADAVVTSSEASSQGVRRCLAWWGGRGCRDGAPGLLKGTREEGYLTTMRRRGGGGGVGEAAETEARGRRRGGGDGDGGAGAAAAWVGAAGGIS